MTHSCKLAQLSRQKQACHMGLKQLEKFQPVHKQADCATRQAGLAAGGCTCRQRSSGGGMYFIISCVKRRPTSSCAWGEACVPSTEAMMAAIKPARALELRDTRRYSGMPFSACTTPSSRAVPAPASAHRCRLERVRLC